MDSESNRPRDGILELLAKALGSRERVRVLLTRDTRRDPGFDEVEGLIQEMGEGRDGRMRVRIAIPTGSGDPVEVRVLVERIARIEAGALGAASASKDGSSTQGSGPVPVSGRPITGRVPTAPSIDVPGKKPISNRPTISYVTSKKSGTHTTLPSDDTWSDLEPEESSTPPTTKRSR